MLSPCPLDLDVPAANLDVCSIFGMSGKYCWMVTNNLAGLSLWLYLRTSVYDYTTRLSLDLVDLVC